MAIYKVEAPDGSIIQIEGPEGATDEQLIAAAQSSWTPQAQAATRSRSGLERLITGDPQEPETTPAGLAGAATRGIAPVATGAGLGFLAGGPPGAAAGAGAMVLTPLVGDPIVSGINELLGTDYQLPSQALEDLMTRIGIAEPKTAAERIVQTVSSGASGAGGTASLGRAIAGGAKSPTIAAAGQQLAAQPLQQVVSGAGAGAGAQGVAESGGGTAEQLIGGIVGGLAGARAVPTPRTPSPYPLQSQGQQDAELARRQGIDLLTSDVLPPQTFASKWAQSAGEKIPYAGTGPVRESQQKQRIDAIRSFIGQYGVDDAGGSEKIMRDLSTKRGDELAKYSGLKNEVIDRLNNKGVVSVGGATKAIDAKIAELEGMRTAEVAPLVSMLADFKQAISGQGLRNIEELRKQLGQTLASNPNLASVKSRGEKIARDVYRALNDDMGAFIQKNGETRDVTKWKVGNKRLESLAGELNVDSLKRTLAKGSATPEIVDRMLFSLKPSEIRSLHSGLTNEGREHARAAIVAKAAKAAKVGDDISPEKFTNEMRRLAPSVNVFFSDKDMKAIDGLTRALDLTRQASKASLSPATGVQATIPIGAAVLTDMLGSGGAALASGAGVGLLARAYESPRARDLMLRLASTKRGSDAEAAIARRLFSVMQSQKNMKEDKK